jgi:voltage-gated potassium channel
MTRIHYIKSELDYSPLRQARQLAVLLASALILHSLSMMWFEGLSAEDAVWLTMSTATTVGYGDLAPKTLEGRLATIIFIYLGGILVAARIGVLYFDYLLERRMKIVRGKWQWKMKHHLVFINAPHEGAQEYFELAVQDLRQSGAGMSEIPVMIHSEEFGEGIPETLRNLGVAHVHAPRISAESIKKASIIDAAVIIILAKNSYDQASDSIAFDLIHRLRAMGCNARIIAESTHKENKPRLLKAGANIVIRPIRSYPELVVRSIIAPGSEMIIEELLGHEGATCRRYDLEITAEWVKLQELFNVRKWGLLIGYIDQKNRQFIGSGHEGVINVRGLLSIVHEDRVPPPSTVIEDLKEVFKE